jgi:ABC-2 type transport system ATP-binding protein
MMVRTQALTKVYSGHAALDSVDLAVAEGSVYGLVGPNGAGKTTLLTLLARLRRPTSGTLHLGAARERVALLPDTPQFDPWLTGPEVLSLAQRLVAPAAPDRAAALASRRGWRPRRGGGSAGTPAACCNGWGLRHARRPAAAAAA